MRILHVAEAFGGGLLQMVVEVAEGAARDGHDVAIAYGVRPETPDDLRATIDDRVELHPLGWTSRRPDAQLRGARELRALVKAWSPDVVHLHSSFSGVIGAAVVPSAIPTIFSPNAFASALPEGGELRRRLYRGIERVACRRVTLVGAVSDSEAELAHRLGARRVVTVPNGISELDPERVRTRPADEPPREPPLVVATGRTVPQRRPEACARILAAVSDVAEVAWLGGGGGARGVAGAAALRASGIEPTGWLPREEGLRRLQDATAYLHWTAWDGLPFSVLEAIALDVVVVASDIPPNREILGPDGVRATEAAAVALLREIVADPARAEELRAVQRRRRGRFAAQEMVRRWLDVYADLAR